MASEEGRTRTFELSLVTPEGAAFEGEVEMIIVPGDAGEIGVLARHAPLVAMLRAGETRVKADGDWSWFATGPGFFKVQQDRAMARLPTTPWLRATSTSRTPAARSSGFKASSSAPATTRTSTAGSSSSDSGTRRTRSRSPGAPKRSGFAIRAALWMCESGAIQLRRGAIRLWGPRDPPLGRPAIAGGPLKRHNPSVATATRLSVETALRELLDERILVLDGAWGTMLQRQGLEDADYRGERFRDHPRDVKGDPDILNLTRPDVVLDVHRQYLAAGADMTTTNTFTATSIGQADYGLEDAVHDMNVEGARLARQAADEAAGGWRFVAGSIGPLNQTLSLKPKVEDLAFRRVTFDQVRESYAEQIRAASSTAASTSSSSKPSSTR